MAELDFDKLYKDAKRTQDMLEEESLWFGRGSSEYKNVKEQMAQDMAIWDNLAQRKKEDTNYQISAYELQMINRLLVNQDEMIDTYLENKEEEKKNLEAKGKDLSKTSEDRITAMKRAKTTINTQMSTIDDAMKDLLNDGPAPSTADIKKETESIHKELDDADKGVWFGSGRYNLAKQQFQGIETDW
ncbi:MAG: hypothetical protein J6Y89_00665, partial [Lachnospiraceae bacterium]|nr:hypothetical protein [Lachnospiraceae bacterium]